jgi:heme-degrading monooxygenase HmoA
MREMFVTVAEAHVAEEQWSALQSAYAAGIEELPAGIVQTYLLHSVMDPAVWQIMSIWASREAILAMRHSGQAPGAIAMFRAAGAEPTHGAFEIAMQGNGV